MNKAVLSRLPKLLGIFCLFSGKRLLHKEDTGPSSRVFFSVVLLNKLLASQSSSLLITEMASARVAWPLGMNMPSGLPVINPVALASRTYLLAH